MSGPIHIENIRTKMVHLGKERVFGRGAMYVAYCKGYWRSGSEYRPTDRAIDCKRCLQKEAKP